MEANRFRLTAVVEIQSMDDLIKVAIVTIVCRKQKLVLLQ